MKRKFNETQKNYMVCAVLVLMCGIGLFIKGQNTVGIICVVLCVIFAVMSIVMYIKDFDPQREIEKKEEERNRKRKISEKVNIINGEEEESEEADEQ